jgi:hypothetical protein
MGIALRNEDSWDLLGPFGNKINKMGEYVFDKGTH